jgi:hypothetical protein
VGFAPTTWVPRSSASGQGFGVARGTLSECNDACTKRHGRDRRAARDDMTRRAGTVRRGLARRETTRHSAAGCRASGEPQTRSAPEQGRSRAGPEAGREGRGRGKKRRCHIPFNTPPCNTPPLQHPLLAPSRFAFLSSPFLLSVASFPPSFPFASFPFRLPVLLSPVHSLFLPFAPPPFRSPPPALPSRSRLAAFVSRLSCCGPRFARLPVPSSPLRGLGRAFAALAEPSRPGPSVRGLDLAFAA